MMHRWRPRSAFRAPAEARTRAREHCDWPADVGGAASPLAFYLAEQGHSGVAVERQETLTDVCRHVAMRRKLKLSAVRCNFIRDAGPLGGPFDLITLVSVFEHIPAADHPGLFKQAHDLLRPGGLFYLTFDYGPYQTPEAADQNNAEYAGASTSINDIAPVCEQAAGVGFKFIGNDPRSLPPELKEQKSAPACRDVAWQYEMNIGAVDAQTPWGKILKYAVKRLLRVGRHPATRFAEPNFFRMFLERAN